MMKEVNITLVTIDEIAALQRISRQTFEETFSEVNSVDNMTSYVEESFSSDKLSCELSNLSSRFYFCFVDNQVVGYMKLNSGQAQTEIRHNHAMEIERIYVLKAFHGKKVGLQLFEEAIKVAEQTRMEYVWLGVWEHNERAINFYKKNGFTEFDQHIFHLGSDQQIDLLMKKKLTHLSNE